MRSSTRHGAQRCSTDVLLPCVSKAPITAHGFAKIHLHRAPVAYACVRIFTPTVSHGIDVAVLLHHVKAEVIPQSLLHRFCSRTYPTRRSDDMVVEFVISCRTGENGRRSLDGDRVYVNIVIISVHLHDLAWTLTCIDGYDEAAHGSCGSPVYVEDNQEYHKGHTRGDDVLTASRGHDLLNKGAVEHSGCRMPSKTCPQSSMNVASVSHLCRRSAG